MKLSSWCPACDRTTILVLADSGLSWMRFRYWTTVSWIDYNKSPIHQTQEFLTRCPICDSERVFSVIKGGPNES